MLTQSQTAIAAAIARMSIALRFRRYRSQSRHIGPQSPQSCSSEKTQFGAPWKMSTIFREIFCGHFPWKLQDENLRKISPKFRRIFRRSLRKISQELRSGGLRAQQYRPKMVQSQIMLGCTRGGAIWASLTGQ